MIMRQNGNPFRNLGRLDPLNICLEQDGPQPLPLVLLGHGE